jgi:hypothetical protein
MPVSTRLQIPRKEISSSIVLYNARFPPQPQRILLYWGPWLQVPVLLQGIKTRDPKIRLRTCGLCGSHSSTNTR